MKRRTIMLLAVLCAATASAQDILGPVEIEVGVGSTFSGSCMGSGADPALCMTAEVRYNFEAPWDLGLHFGLGSVWRDWQRYDGKFRYRDYLAVGDYNLRRGKNFSLFVGAGVGFSTHRVRLWDNDIAGHRTDYAFSCMPRVGIELFRCVRLSAGYVITRRHYDNLQVGVSVVFGGWKKR